ncbi:MAG: DUF2442 domain-containing protein [Verrucomicrobiales bacterium]|nr:DUF2442 domain-containing protein [Verrucomicrobiales bacterium]
MRKITNVAVLKNYQVELVFDDQTKGVADLSHLIGKGVFSVWNDYSVFEQALIGEAGQLVWPGEIDLCPDSLYLKVTGQEPEEVFPTLKHQPSHA